EGWVQHRSGQRYLPEERPFQRAAGFCGLGNPQSFRRTLEKMGVELVEWFEFSDHHRYRPHELLRIAEQARIQGAAALVTTEKDTINLCESCDDLLAPLPLFWLDVGMSIEPEDEFQSALERWLRGFKNRRR
ncbi:MAG TPA: tetraacyldisaccharide 4'-kinase, partial [Bryobacteraceae bacterium]